MFLSIVHLRERRCILCGELIAAPGARSFIVDDRGDPIAFSAEGPPELMQVAILCENGHVNAVDVPGDASAEESMNTPYDAPIARDALYKGETS